jgi:hypothetical protein
MTATQLSSLGDAAAAIAERIAEVDVAAGEEG